MLSGWLMVDKPEGITSFQVVRKIRHALQIKKVGHAGTLDPLASGLLPIACGEATKTISFLQESRKKYSFRIAWGEARSTDDREGEIIKTSSARPSRSEIQAVIPKFIGEIQQVPPIFSAIHVDGERAYKRARRGETVELKKRPVTIHSLKILEGVDDDSADFEVTCGKGFYVRSLARDMAEMLGTVGHIAILRRLEVGKFSPTISLEETADALKEQLLPVHAVLDDLPTLVLSEDEARRLRQGQGLTDDGQWTPEKPEEVMAAFYQEQLVAIVRKEGLTIRPSRVFNV